MQNVCAGKVASTAARCALPSPLALSDTIVAEEGYCLAVRALGEKARYNELECADGVFREIRKGDVLVGVLGARRALKGYSGHVPRRIQPGDTLHVLNLGGLLGWCAEGVPGLGPALPVEVLGAALVEQEGGRRYACIQDHALEPVHTLTEAAPLIVVSGTSMHTGKTSAACRIVEGLTARGLRVAAAKLTGAALMRDASRMEAHGAVACATFTDAGIASSVGKDVRPYAKGIVAHLSATDPDAIVVELGDGFVGYYGVDALLRDRELQHFARAHVVAATDLAGAWAADRRFRETYRAPITAMTGPVTDSAAGRQFVQHELGVPALNALQDGDRLAGLVAQVLAAPEATQVSPDRRPAPCSQHRAPLSVQAL